MSKCKICQSNLVNRIDQELNHNCDIKQLQDWCLNRGLKISIQTLKNHKSKHLSSNQNVSVQLAEDIDIVNFDSYCDSIGMSVDDFKNLDENIENVIYGAQRAITMLFFKNTAIADKKLDLVMKDEMLYPTEEIKGLKNVSEIFLTITGLQNRINENVAIKTLESRGYTISKGYIDIDAETE